MLTHWIFALSTPAFFAAIKRYRHDSAELGTIDELADPVRYAAAETEIGASGAALFATRPASVAGAVALIDFIVEDDLDTEGSWSQAEAYQRGGLSNLSLGGGGAGGGASSASGWPGMSETKASETG